MKARRCTAVLMTAAVALAASALPVAAQSTAPGTATGRGRDDDVTIRLVTHDSFAISKKVLRDFTRRTGIDVEVLPAGDAGAALNQVILTKDDPIGDVLFGVDNTFLSRALTEDIFLKADVPNAKAVPAALRLDPSDRAVPIDHGAVCVNYDKQWFEDHDLAVPRTLGDLTKPKYRDLLVVENPATSSPGLAFLLATVDRFGEGGWQKYWSTLRENGVEVVNGWEEAFNGSFSGGEGNGDRPLVVSYASSPPVAVYFSDPQPKESPIGTVLGTCFDQIEFAGVLRGTDHPAAARKLVNFMLSKRFQEDIPLQMFVFPARPDAQLPAVFEKFAEIPHDPATLPPETIGEHREQWIDEWTDTVLR
ncbi:MAG: thiamine ABC transporter substrate-binding protein [Acidimicrobiia bacterium]|jgi:thiamine transport system substrate-binding protein